YVPMVVSLIATGFLAFGLWVHHMFVTGIPQLGAAFFTAASMMVAIPSGVQIFCWLATLWDGRLVYSTALLFCLGFIPIFGLAGMPRRVYTYPDGIGWSAMNLLASIGAAIIAISIVIFLANLAWSLRRGAIAGDNPWGAGTLEWATASPPPAYNFAAPPIVAGREPLWVEPDVQRVATGLRSDIREVLVTHLLDASPDHRYPFPDPSIWPLLAALATTGMFIG